LNTTIRVKKTQFKHLNGAYFPLVVIDNQLDMVSASYLLQRYNNGLSLKTLDREASAIRKLYANTLYKFMALMTPKDSGVNCYSFSGRIENFDRLVTAISRLFRVDGVID